MLKKSRQLRKSIKAQLPTTTEKALLNDKYEFTAQIIDHLIGIMQKQKHINKNYPEIINWTAKDEFLFLWLPEARRKIANKKYIPKFSKKRNNTPQA